MGVAVLGPEKLFLSTLPAKLPVVEDDLFATTAGIKTGEKKLVPICSSKTSAERLVERISGYLKLPSTRRLAATAKQAIGAVERRREARFWIHLPNAKLAKIDGMIRAR